LKQADVLPKTFAPRGGFRASWPLATMSVSAINPKIHLCPGGRGFGDGSPYEGRVCHSIRSLRPRAGRMRHQPARRDGEARQKPGPTIGDTGYFTGMLLAFSIVSALFDSCSPRARGRRLQVANGRIRSCINSRGAFITAGAHRRRGASPVPPANKPAGRDLSRCKPGGPNDYVYLLTSRAKPRALASAAVEADRARGSDRQSALRDPRPPG